MEQLSQALSDQIITYRELLALAYAQKEAIQANDLTRVTALLSARQGYIQQARERELVVARLVAEEFGEHPTGTTGGLFRRLLSEGAMLLEKLISLDKENERLLEMKTAQR